MVERYVQMSGVTIDPPDFETTPARRPTRRTPRWSATRTQGLRYLVPRSATPRPSGSSRTSSRARASSASRGRSTSAPRTTRCRCSGVQYFDFDLWGKNKQLSVFFAGALLFGNYTDPSLLGSRFDLGADLFAVAFPFVEQNYVGGEEIIEESIKHLPALFQVNIGHPIGPYLKASLGLFTRTGTTTSATTTRARSSSRPSTPGPTAPSCG